MADKIICVAETMKTYFATLTQAEKISVIPNGFDADDFNEVLGSRSTQDNKKVKFVFTGTLYINLEYIFEPFLKALKKIKDENKDLYRSVTFEFIGTFPTSYRLLIDKYDVKDCITIKQPLPLREVYKTINEADYCMLFLNNVYSFALSTKFCEYISQRKKIIIVSSKGEAVDFILNNKLGYWVNPETAYENLVNIIQATLNKDGAKWNSEFDINEFSLKKLTEHLIKQIEY
jgi:glycosyltransferase involved in cell wall biosynthesis